MTTPSTPADTYPCWLLLDNNAPEFGRYQFAAEIIELLTGFDEDQSQDDKIRSALMMMPFGLVQEFIGCYGPKKIVRVLWPLSKNPMTQHDRARMERALACDRTNLDSVVDALRGLQSTDDPTLLPLHDDLMVVYRTLREQKQKQEEKNVDQANPGAKPDPIRGD